AKAGCAGRGAPGGLRHPAPAQTSTLSAFLLHIYNVRRRKSSNNMTASLAELGIDPRTIGIVHQEAQYENEAGVPVVAHTEVAEAELTLTPYQILEQGFIDSANGDGLIRIKKKRETGRKVQVLTNEAKDLSEAFVDALCGPNLEGLDQENLIAQVDEYYHRLVDSGYNKTAAYRIKQSANFKIQNRIYLQNILAEQLATKQAVTSSIVEGTSRFGRLKEIGRGLMTAASLGVALLGLTRLTQAKEDLPVANFAAPTPIVMDYRAHLANELDQINAEQRYFSSLPYATVTANAPEYSVAQTGTNNPEAPDLEIMQGSMTLSFTYPDGSTYTYGQQVGIEDKQDFNDVELDED
ncbi:MAG: hypothetical protein UZ22_OP11002000323, partial [Microgenomates bacterium OLB23]